MQSLKAPAHEIVPADYLQDEIRKVCGSFDLKSFDRRDRVAGGIAPGAVGGFDMIAVALAQCEVARDSHAVRQDPGEHLFLLLQEEGHCRIEQSGQTRSLQPGDLFLVDSVRPSVFTYDGAQSGQISLHLPRAEMRRRFGEVCLGGVAIDRNDPLWLAMRAVIAKMLIAPGAQASLGEAFLGILGAYFQGLQGTGRPASTLLSRALALIERHGADPAFGPRELASRLNVSERMLQRHFEPLGETPVHRLLSRRLELAHARLSQAEAAIASIAYESGFNDLSYFYREFRKKYGMTPGAAQRCH